jgi:opacity protein-like surface antigen
MRKLAFSTVAALAVASLPAQAADVALKAAPAPAAVSWQGLYLDGYFQYGGNITHAESTVGGTSTIDLAAIPHGPGIGTSLGYNYDTGGVLIFGVRADISWLNMSDSSQVSNGALQFSNATNYLGSLDGVACGALTADRRLILCGLGGFAFGGAKPNLSVGSLQQAASDTSAGWNVGAALRFKVPNSNWAVFAEGDYYQLGDKSLSLVDGSGNTIATSTAKYHIITQKFGVSYQF